MTDKVSLKQEVKELKEEKYQSQKLSDQMTELRSMVSDYLHKQKRILVKNILLLQTV